MTKTVGLSHLSPLAYEVTQNKGTEVPFSGDYNNHYEEGVYCCKCCQSVLYESSKKYDSGSGWPSFFIAMERAVKTRLDNSHHMERTEIICATCGAHLGHFFDDGPPPTYKRHCVNSVSLMFKKSIKTQSNNQ